MEQLKIFWCYEGFMTPYRKMISPILDMLAADLPQTTADWIQCFEMPCRSGVPPICESMYTYLFTLR